MRSVGEPPGGSDRSELSTVFVQSDHFSGKRLQVSRALS